MVWLFKVSLFFSKKKLGQVFLKKQKNNILTQPWIPSISVFHLWPAALEEKTKASSMSSLAVECS